MTDIDVYIKEESKVMKELAKILSEEESIFYDERLDEIYQIKPIE